VRLAIHDPDAQTLIPAYSVRLASMRRRGNVVESLFDEKTGENDLGLLITVQ
jgi:hypothetical protein